MFNVIFITSVPLVSHKAPCIIIIITNNNVFLDPDNNNIPAPSVGHTCTTLSQLLCNNVHIHIPQTAICFSHSPPRPAFVLSHLQNKLRWKLHYKLPCVCQIPWEHWKSKPRISLPPQKQPSEPHTQYILITFKLTYNPVL